MTILVTGGAGYIGSHTVIELLQQGKSAVVLDNLCNSSRISLDRILALSEENDWPGRFEFVQGDIRDSARLDDLFSKYNFESVIHFAGLKAVGESNEKPLSYYDNNVSGTLSLCMAMAKADVKNLVFSSSATVYGDVESVPICEATPTGRPTNPYGRSKLMVEEILQDLSSSDSSWSICLLRYFNPVGAHISGAIGEDPNGPPNNLVPYISQVAVGRRESLSVFGNDYETKDGTGVRDYIHVTDLAKGHLAALNWMKSNRGVGIWNLGTGNGYSVFEMVAAFEKASGKPVPFKVVNRRPGDIGECWADPSKALEELGWKAELTLDRMMEDTWRWQSSNPEGFK